MKHNDITAIIIDESIKIHRQLGPGLFESVYEEVLERQLIKRGLSVRRQVPIPVYFDEIKMEVGFRADLIVHNKVIVEVKSVEVVPKTVLMQMKTYLTFTGLQVALLINFNVVVLKDGLSRFVLNYKEE